MKKVMLLVLLCGLKVFGANSDMSQLDCIPEGASAVAASVKLKPTQSIAFSEGSSFGDGVNSVYILSYTVSEINGYHLVMLSTDGCEASKVIRINN